MRKNYSKILHMQHHISATRPRMTESSRAAQFAPFAALTGLGAAHYEEARTTDGEATLTSEECDEINRRLIAASENPQSDVEITYFEPDRRKSGGSYTSATGCVKSIDPIEGYITLTDKKKIPLFRIVAIRGDLFDE